MKTIPWGLNGETSKTLLRRCPKDSKFLSMSEHQVGLKDPGSQNFGFLAFMGEAVGVVQI
jgi:hypothetical protein